MTSDCIHTVRAVTRLRPLTEAECYARCYGDRDDNVTIIRVQKRRGAGDASTSREEVRRRFEQRLESRPADAVVEPEAA